MQRYSVEFTKKNLMNDSPPHGPYVGLSYNAESFEDAAVMATRELVKIGFMSGHNDVWDATIFSPKGRYEILKAGSWLIDAKTGKKLEAKVAENQ